MKLERIIRKNAFLIIVVILIVLLVLNYRNTSTKEGFNAGRTIVINENDNICAARKKTIGASGKDISQTLSAEGVVCDAGFTPIFSTNGSGILFNCGKNIQICDDDYKYNKNSSDPNKMCVNFFNNNDRKGVKTGASCPSPKGDEIRIISGPWCQIMKTKPIRCATGLTYSSLLQKCYKCS